jgi:hypothetical protein
MSQTPNTPSDGSELQVRESTPSASDSGLNKFRAGTRGILLAGIVGLTAAACNNLTPDSSKDAAAPDTSGNLSANEFPTVRPSASSKPSALTDGANRAQPEQAAVVPEEDPEKASFQWVLRDCTEDPQTVALNSGVNRQYVRQDDGRGTHIVEWCGNIGPVEVKFDKINCGGKDVFITQGYVIADGNVGQPKTIIEKSKRDPKKSRDFYFRDLEGNNIRLQPDANLVVGVKSEKPACAPESVNAATTRVAHAEAAPRGPYASQESVNALGQRLGAVEAEQKKQGEEQKRQAEEQKTAGKALARLQRNDCEAGIWSADCEELNVAASANQANRIRKSH